MISYKLMNEKIDEICDFEDAMYNKYLNLLDPYKKRINKYNCTVKIERFWHAFKKGSVSLKEYRLLMDINVQ